MITAPAMQTQRLSLRPLVIADAGRIAELAGDWDVASMTGRIPYPYSPEEAREWVTGLADGEVVYGITLRGELIGICGYLAKPGGSAEIGYWIGKPYWRNGFATEAVRRLMEHGFTKGGVRRFTCSHFVENDASARVITKLGFRRLGHSSGWCAARGMEMPALSYERRRSITATLRSLAS